MMNFSKLDSSAFSRITNRDLREIVGDTVSEIDGQETHVANTARTHRRESAARRTAGVTTDSENRILTVSPSFEKHTGYCLAECVGKYPSFMQGPDTSEFAVAQFRALVLTRKQGLVTIINHRKSGEPFVNEVLILPMHDRSGAFVGFTSVHDIM